MTITPEKLRRLAKMSPMFAAEFNAAADKLERLTKITNQYNATTYQNNSGAVLTGADLSKYEYYEFRGGLRHIIGSGDVSWAVNERL